MAKFSVEFNRLELKVFSKTGRHTRAKELSLPYYLPIAGENGRIHSFPKDINPMRNGNKTIQDLNLEHRVHFSQR